MPRSAIIMPIAAPSPSGSRPPRGTTVLVRRFGFWRVAPFFFAACRAAIRAWRARSTPLSSAPCILGWLIDGARRYLAGDKNLTGPERVRIATTA